MTTASPDVVAGRIVGVFGVRGELKCDPSNAGRTLFSADAEFAWRRGEEAGTLRIAAVRPHKGRLLIRIAGIDDLAQAQAFIGTMLYAPRERVDLAKGEYLDADLVGCAVFGADGTSYGIVERVEHYPASDMLVVDGKMVPLVRAIVTEIDMTAHRITIDPPAGLLE